MQQKKSSEEDVKLTNNSSGNDVKQNRSEDVPYSRFREKVQEVRDLKSRMENMEKELNQKSEDISKLNQKSEVLSEYQEVIDGMAESEQKNLSRMVGDDKFHEIKSGLDLEKLSPLERLQKTRNLKKLFGNMKSSLENTRKKAGDPLKTIIANPEEALRRKLEKGNASPREKKLFLKSLRRNKS